MKKVCSMTALGFMLAIIFTAAMPARAQNVDQRIRTLEDELTRLKTEQAQVKVEQIELKKNALAAEGALPTFSYRAGNGLLIEAADKAWSIRFSMEAHMRMLFMSGRMHAGRTNGEVMGRRFRQRTNFCVLNCFYEIEFATDFDGFGTRSDLQRGAIWVHLEEVSPWLPTFYTGMDVPAQSNEFSSGSSSTGAQSEYDLLTRALPNTGSQSQGFGFNWDDRSLSAIGIPGRITRFNFTVGGLGEAGDGRSSNKDMGQSMLVYLGLQPFSELKSKWLQGWSLGVGAWFCHIDGFDSGSGAGANNYGADGENGCDRLRIRDNGDAGRQVLFDTSSSIGRGLSTYIYPGVQWEVGPYRLRVSGGFARWANGTRPRATPFIGKTVGNNFLIAHELFVWSPKGWLTGSSGTPGSVLIGTHFERTDVDCNSGKGGQGPFGGGPVAGGCTGFGFNRNTILVREWDVYYFLMNRVSVGIVWTYYDATNLPFETRRNLGLASQKGVAPSSDGGRWLDMHLNLRYRF